MFNFITHIMYASDSRSQFNAAVSQFRAEGKTSLEELIKNETVFNYLTRPFESVLFNDKGPVLGKEADAQELWVYENFKIPYRDKITKGDFYKSEINSKKILTKRLEDLRKNSPCYFLPFLDIHAIKNNIDQFELQDKIKSPVTYDKNFVVSLNSKRNHATVLLHILDLSRKRVLATIFINSWIEEDHFLEMAKLFFNTSGFHNLNEDFLSKHSSLEEYKEDYLEFKNDYDWPRVSNKRKIPFISAVHNLQREDDDLNCSLYAFNFATAIGEMLKEPKTQAEVLSLAHQIDADPSNGYPIGNIRSIFQDKLTQFLPQYYDSAGARKDFYDVKDYHMKLRWDLGKEYIESMKSNSHP